MNHETDNVNLSVFNFVGVLYIFTSGKNNYCMIIFFPIFHTKFWITQIIMLQLIICSIYKNKLQLHRLTILTQISVMKSATTITGKRQQTIFTYSTIFTSDSFTEIYIYNVKIENLERIRIVTHFQSLLYRNTNQHSK